MNKIFRRAIAIAMLLILTAGASAETVIATGKTKIYQNPDKSSKSMIVSAGASMEKLAAKDGWIKVEKDGKTAYVRESDVESVKDHGGAAGWVKKASPLYKSYGSSDSYGTMPEGAKLAVHASAGDWAYVEYQGKKGYVKLENLSKKAPETSGKVEADDEDDSEDVVYFNNLVAYAKDGAKVYKSNSTSSKKLGTLKENETVTVDSLANGWCRVKKDGKVGFIKMTQLSLEKIGGSSDKKEEQTSSKVQEMDWWTSGIQSIFARGVTATITDVETGLSWKEIRKGGTNHADVQPCTAEDTAKLKQAYGGKWSWDRRAIIVTINGKNYAASMNGMPHGGDSVANNNFDGHHCIHFTNSRGHSSNAVCPLHQAAIQKALKAKL